MQLTIKVQLLYSLISQIQLQASRMLVQSKLKFHMTQILFIPYVQMISQFIMGQVFSNNFQFLAKEQKKLKILLAQNITTILLLYKKINYLSLNQSIYLISSLFMKSIKLTNSYQI
ncbi:hypothetical protein TTHERM_000812605 (macronuclear) [Tetrahymena thermophila SB210]|uniref:Uncharacterized protein n=1 Tax=Tetrahymena thermophila (strain SB210) TaxID=312017 RepID=W7XEQ8_TETTS|nr:hypothetical protein TTHERM_000812605 [Tetrahymena thermophila SB210]EWS76252.1 hypothetical protein TTHERM_000812605 [Tetrahymena thermophila SB210]|eukprot:XP_012651211.1 hypothetical protein TTHERM_000812605 [Tetrahymena thermophila SB210]